MRDHNEQRFITLSRRLIAMIGVIVPRRFRARFRQEWEAELEYREELLARWDRLDWRNKLKLLWRSLGAFWDALWLQRQRWEDEMIQDLRFGARMLLKDKGFTAVAVLSLALGIGANTAIFSLIDAVLLKPLPVERPEQLYFIQNVGTQNPGRGFTDADNESAPRVALFNESAARFYFGDRSPLGTQIRFGYDPRYEKEPPAPYEIVGVVKDARYDNLREPDLRMIYLPLAQKRDRLSGPLTLAVRAEGRPTDLIAAISNEVRAAGSDILITNIATLNEQIDQSLVQERLVATLSLFFGALALLLACVGLYGVMSYDVALRRHEIGVRMALGANAGRVMRLVLRETLLWVALGAALGLGAALATTRWVESLLFGLEPHDPVTIGLAAIVLLAVAAVAAYLPARRASRVDPMAALRHE
jgi:hypothetical protein